jgi:WD40 repeat protein
MAVTPDGRLAISASADQTLKVWELATGRELHTLGGHAGGVYAVAVTPDGLLALSAEGDRTLRMWDLESGNSLATFISDAAMYSIAIAAKDLFVVGSEDGRVHILRLLGGEV